MVTIIENSGISMVVGWLFFFNITNYINGNFKEGVFKPKDVTNKYNKLLFNFNYEYNGIIYIYNSDGKSLVVINPDIYLLSTGLGKVGGNIVVRYFIHKKEITTT